MPWKIIEGSYKKKGLFTLLSVALFAVGVARKKSQVSTLNVTLNPKEKKQSLLVKVKKIKFMIFSSKGKGFALSSGIDKKPNLAWHYYSHPVHIHIKT